MEKSSGWLDYQGTIAGHTAGLFIRQPTNREPIPWFARDYGFVGVNQFRTGGELKLRQGEAYKLDVLIARARRRSHESGAAGSDRVVTLLVARASSPCERRDVSADLDFLQDLNLDPHGLEARATRLPDRRRGRRTPPQAPPGRCRSRPGHRAPAKARAPPQSRRPPRATRRGGCGPRRSARGPAPRRPGRPPAAPTRASSSASAWARVGSPR